MVKPKWSKHGQEAGAATVTAPFPPPGWRVGEWPHGELRARRAACAVALEPADSSKPMKPPTDRLLAAVVCRRRRRRSHSHHCRCRHQGCRRHHLRARRCRSWRAHSWRAVTAPPPMRQRRPCSPSPLVSSPASPGQLRHGPRSQLHRIRAQRRRQRQRCNYLLHSSTPFHFQVPLAVKPRLCRNHTGIFLKRLLFVHKCGLFHCHPDCFLDPRRPFAFRQSGLWIYSRAR